MKKIILASKSPRRLEIMRNHGIEPIVLPSNTDEKLPDKIDMEEAVKMLALQKAKSTYDMIKDDEQYNNCLIIGADTIVYKNEILGKPYDYNDAVRMLKMIRGTSHYVATGVAIIDTANGNSNILCDVTEVHCIDFSDDDIHKYIVDEQPFDKAGSYAIQGSFRKYIEKIEGDYENVVGLPFYRIESFLK